MLKWIERTRKKPKVVRDQYAFMGAIVITGVIVLGWLVTLPIRFEGLTLEIEGVEDSRGAFSQFLNNARDQAAAVIEVGESEEEAESVATTTPPSTERWPLGTTSDETYASTLLPVVSATGSATIPSETEQSEPELTPRKGRVVYIATTSKQTATSTEDSQ